MEKKISTFIYSTGKRKTSISRIFLKEGKGDFIINKKPLESYFPWKSLHILTIEPLIILNCKNEFNIFCTVKGGGFTGQAESIRLGLSKVLVKYDEENYKNYNWRKILRKSGKFLTRDSRKVERKKFGLRKARKSVQFSKR